AEPVGCACPLSRSPWLPRSATAATALFWLLAQQMACIGEQFRYCVGFGRFVITTNFTTSIHQDQPGAVYRNSGYIAPIRNRKFEAIARKVVNRGFCSSKKIPALW